MARPLRNLTGFFISPSSPVLSVVLSGGPVKAPLTAHGSLNRLASRLILIAHAATEAQRRAAFPLDEPLEQREMAKIATLGWKAPRSNRIVSGPERRAKQTAEALGLLAEKADELRDCDYGAWRGYTLSEVEQRQPEEVLAWLSDPGAAPHGGESILQLITRIRDG